MGRLIILNTCNITCSKSYAAPPNIHILTIVLFWIKVYSVPGYLRLTFCHCILLIPLYPFSNQIAFIGMGYITLAEYYWMTCNSVYMRTGIVVIPISICKISKQTEILIILIFGYCLLYFSPSQMIWITKKSLSLSQPPYLLITSNMMLSSHPTSMNWVIMVPCYEIKQWIHIRLSLIQFCKIPGIFNSHNCLWWIW